MIPYHKKYSEYLQLSAEYDFIGGLTSFLSKFGIQEKLGYAIASSLFSRMNCALLSYHTPLHVLSALSWAEENNIILEPWEELALWFHDAIYDVTAPAGNNEIYSAGFMKLLLHPYVPVDVSYEAVNGILATAEFMEKVDSKFNKIMDIDICSFSFDRENHKATNEAVQKEYKFYFSEDEVTKGRKKFLKALLDRGFMYRTPEIIERFDRIARQNIKLDLEED